MIRALALYLLSASVLSAVLVAPAASVAQPAEPTAASTPGEQAAAAGDWVAAAAAFEVEATERGGADAWYRYGVALAMAGDAAGAALAFRNVAELAPDFPNIGERIAAAEARAARDLEERLDPPGFLVDDAVTLDARREALDRGDLLYASRAAAGLPAGSAIDADADEARLLAMLDAAATFAVAAAGQEPGNAGLYLEAADALRLAGRLDVAWYYLRLYLELGGDPLEAAPVRQAIDRAETPGR